MLNLNKTIITTTLGLAGLAIAIDHTRHPLPEPVDAPEISTMDQNVDEIEPMPDGDSESPCSLGNPCALNLAPCALD